MSADRPAPGEDRDAVPTAAPARLQIGPAQLLLDLVADPRDPGYAAAAARRAARGETGDRPRVAERVTVWLGCLLIGFLLVLAYVHTHRGAPEATKVREGLIARVHDAQRSAAGLADQVRRLNRDLSAERDRALTDTGLAATLELAQLEAGERAVTGPGFQVVLSEPSPPTPTAAPGHRAPPPAAGGNILTDRDVRSVVNQLWAAGAEAVAVNGVRLLPTSAVRFAGDAVLVDLQPVTPPYTIRAIGDPGALAVGFASSDVASRYQTLSSARGIGFRFSEQRSLNLPAGAPVTLRYASVPEGSR